MHRPQSAYIHIPFCRRRCFYCDFPIAVAGDRARGETSPRIQTYVETLCREIRATPSIGEPLQTVFFGGGTPSLLAVAQVEQILATLTAQFGLAATTEISMEMDPGTFTRDGLRSLQQVGINRVSLGVQAFNDEQLAACGRTHCVQDVHQAIADLTAVQMPAWSLDLISGLPHQTLTDWTAALEQAIAYAPPHLSVYDLTVEPGTVFHHRYRAGQSPLPSDELTTEMYRLAQQRLTQAGYQHYEISNYARPTYQCQHNRVYWENRPFYGFGMGAASYLHQQRWQRPRTTHTYEAWVDQYCAASHPAANLPGAAATLNDRWLDRLMMGLRLSEGLNLETLTQEFGRDRVERLRDCLKPYQQQQWVAITEPPAPVVQFTDPEGFLFSNVVLVNLFETFGEA
ncbi:MAG: radical SAM family heme chaperone HemW [Cyanobacteria bacterium P01_H01_bin.162]